MSANSKSGDSYTVTSKGTNDQGNSYDHRVSDSGGHSYHYSNSNGSYYYSNSNGSTYYNSGSGYSNYTSPDGNSRSSYSSSK
ncbi:hypothetical protein K466DRAFT_580744 [Polyporus arcularius HHB13444]|uniref:Uncharacterized protein n=1 Tax=Polyporus arcularius HHB13444 TaxID=1314778 RepID=A0A5C3Q011_9APHY|nr:hypothetical protein K466DRAFT_580744 [Polyporus arcularius HHB13444]